MCTGTTFPAWQASCLRQLLALDFVRPALLIVDDAGAQRGTGDRLKRLREVRTLLWNLYSYFSKYSSRSGKLHDLSAELASVPALRCRVTRRGRFSQYFADDDVARIRGHELDFILRFGFNIIRGEILDAARYGVWSFHHDDEEKYRGAPPGFWEVYTADPVTGAILQRLADRLDAGTVLRKGFLRTVQTSYQRNVDSIFMETAGWPAQVCIDIRNGVTGYLDAPTSSTRAPIFRAPTNLQMLRLAVALAGRRLGLMLESLFFEYRWNVGVVAAPIHSFLRSHTPSPRWLDAAAPGHYIADPFAIRDGDTTLALVEEYDFGKSRGHLTALKIAGARTTRIAVAIDVAVHLSYPYLFEHEGQIYCVPETHRAREVALFRADPFPDRWTRVCTLVPDFAGLDATVFPFDGRWWLLATDMDDRCIEKLKAWHAEHLFGPWRPHAQDPVKIDARSARCAGTPFRHEGELYRPAQDCSGGYGSRLTVNRVVRLTPTEFREETVARIDPDPRGPYPHGLHTLSAAGDVTLVDGMRRTFVGASPAIMGHRLQYLVERLRSRFRPEGR